MYWNSPNAMPRPQTARPHIRMPSPLQVPPKNIGSLKLGSFSDASLAEAKSARNAVARSAVIQTQVETYLAIVRRAPSPGCSARVLVAQNRRLGRLSGGSGRT